MMNRLLLALLALTVLASPAAAQDATACGTPAVIDDGWATAKPDDVGLDGARLCGLDKFLEQWPNANIHSVTVARRGKLVFERYFTGQDERWGTPLGEVKFGPETLHDLRSISKSVVSLLVGIALREGTFPSIDSAVFDQFPEYAALKTPEKARITFWHLLTMSSGFAWNEAIPYSNPANSERRLIDSAEPARYVLEQPMALPPGYLYNYNGGNTALLAAVLAKKTGQTLDAYARQKLFAPLGITDSEWVVMPASNTAAAASGARLRPRDLAKIGQLMTSDGAWQGKQVVPRGWVAESTRLHINGEGIYYYGYQWWLGRTLLHGRDRPWIAGFGWGGQRLYIQPDLDLVVTVNAGYYGSPLQGVIPHQLFTRFVLQAVKD